MHKRLPGGRRKKSLLSFLFILLSAASVLAAEPGTSHAQGSPAPADTVVSVAVSGNATVDTGLVVRGFGVDAGSRYSADVIRRGIRRLYDLGFFSDIAVQGEALPGGIALTIQVVENPRVGAVEFTGNEKIKSEDLLSATGPLRGKMADDRLLARVERSVSRVYKEKGYTRVEARPRFLPGDSASRRILLVEVEQGPKIRVEAIRFVGNKRIPDKVLKKAMDQGTTGFLRGGVYKPDVLAQDPERIEAAMAKRGFRDGKVLGHEVLPGSKDDRAVVEIRVEEGPRYYAGSVKWEGNKVLPTPLLYGLSKVEPGAIFNQEKIESTVEGAYGVYADRGYIYLAVRPDYATTDSTVDVTFRVTEGEPSRVRDILITGNTRTKEHVIRRQLVIRPGDLFQRNLLVRSQRELQQLGYFSDLQVNSRPVPDSNDIDLILGVEERQVGTASAGFGFSSAVGLTGFMELGHSNLFGNGQSLNLRMERGSQRNNAELSLTEPWFLGSPTSVGLDLFSTNRIFRGPDLDLEIRRSGGAIRLGRPLPIPYTRVFTTYRLESQKVVDETNPDLDDNPDDSIRFFQTGFRLDQETSLSSSFALSLVRNSTNHPIYPTIGSNSRLRMELSGGPMGGDQVFQKYELDIARYTEAVNLGGWKPVLMLRARLGGVSEAFRDDDDDLIPNTFVYETSIPEGAVWDSVSVGGVTYTIPVPRHVLRYPSESNELFRLGGTSFNALRGYDDFEIVPSDNVSRRYLVTESTDTLGVSTYNVTSSPVFYPGGKYMLAVNTEWQFLIADPLHGLLFADLGGTWNRPGDFRWDSMHKSVGMGFRMEVPLLGLIGFDYGYGFDRLDRATGRYDEKGWEPHIQFGRIF